MNWFAVKNDLVGGWCVANRQAPRSELDPRPTGRTMEFAGGGKIISVDHVATGDRVIAECASEDDAYLLVALLNWWATAGQETHPTQFVRQYTSPWPESEGFYWGPSGEARR